MTWSGQWFIVFVFCVTLGAGCGPAPTAQAPALATPALEAVELGTPVSERVRGVFELLAQRTPIDEAELATRFNPEFLAQVPAEALAVGFEAQREKYVDPVLVKTEENSLYTLRQLYRNADGEHWRIVATVDAAPPHRFSGLAVVPASAPMARSPLAESLDDGSDMGAQLRWILERFELDDGFISHEAIEQRFHSSFLAEVSVEAAAASGPQISALIKGGVLFKDETPSEDRARRRVVVLQAPDGAYWRLMVAIAPEAPHEIVGMGLRTAFDVAPNLPSDWSALEARTQEGAPLPTLLAAELTGDGCVPIAEVNAEQASALGSTFKLYVLLALVRAVKAGELTWSEGVAIQTAFKSLPSGKLQDEAEGTSFSVQEMATLMIQISDNTATDHLIRRVGRELVEEALRDFNSAPDRSIPFLLTKEMFLLKRPSATKLRADYLAGDVARRRELLAEASAGEPLKLGEFMDWKQPLAIDTLEWFASPRDLCGLAARLRDLSLQPEGAALREVLSQNPGVAVDRAVWPWFGFKGGSEPGVMNLTWLLERDDGRVFFLTLGFNNPSEALSENELIILATAAIKLLGGHGR